MLLTRVFGSSGDPERRLKALTVTALTAAIGALLLLGLFLYLAFSEVVDNKARLAALENSTTLASSTASLTERINKVSSDEGIEFAQTINLIFLAESSFLIISRYLKI